MNEKFILDACCGGRMFWFEKHHPNALYIDIRKEKNISKHRPNFEVQPDQIMDFRKLELEDKSFKLVVWDPPHTRRLRETSEFRKKYGSLDPETYPHDLAKGFKEIWRVLENHGVLIFKWNETEIPLKEILDLFPEKPLFGHTTNKKNTTHWLCFMKIPK